MVDTVVFLDANALAAPVTRTLLLAGGRADGLLVTWSKHVEEEAGRHTRGHSARISVVRREILGMRLSRSASTVDGFTTTSPEDRQVMADAAAAAARFLVTADVDDFASEDLRDHRMSAVNPDYFMALRFSEHAYRGGEPCPRWQGILRDLNLRCTERLDDDTQHDGALRSPLRDKPGAR